jgi:predicted type IV restriction endonuclease
MISRTHGNAFLSFKIHLKERYTWVMCRLYFGWKRPTIWLPLAIEEARPLAAQFPMMTPQQGWTCVSIDTPNDLESLGDLIRKAYDQQKASRIKGAESDDRPESPNVVAGAHSLNDSS